MVTFVCEYCDLTLKKSQCDKHILGRCRPAALICIDCSKTFRGNQHKNHTSCISEMDKHWGQYAPSKMKNTTAQNEINKDSLKPEGKEQVKDSNKQEKQQNKQATWKGWKNQIKTAIIEANPEEKKVELQNLKERVLKRYHNEFQKTGQDDKVFLSKLQKLKKVKLVTYVTLN